MNGIDDRFFGSIFYPLKFIQNNAEILNKVHKQIIWNKKATKAVFILPQWMGEIYYYKLLIKKLSKNCTVVLYKIPNKIINQDAIKTVKYFEKAKNEIINIANSLGKKGYKDFSIVGVSITCSLALMVANSDRRYKKIVLSLIGNDFAECFWDSRNLVVKNIRDKMIRNGISLESLKEKWKSIAPINNIKKLNRVEMLVFLSKNDQLVKYEHGLKFIEAIKKKKINYKADMDNIFGHYISGLKQLLFPNKIVKFLEN